MKKACLVVLLALCSLASAQTTTSFTNGGATCSHNLQFNSYYCTGAQTYDLNGAFSGYLGFWFTPQADGSFTQGRVYLNDAHGNVIATYENFAGSFGSVIIGTFGTSGTLTELMGTRKICAGRYGCHTALAVVSGGGSY